MENFGNVLNKLFDFRFDRIITLDPYYLKVLWVAQASFGVETSY